MSFDPNAPAQPGSGIYGLPYTEMDAAVVLLPVPWEATTSYGGGASHGPAAILAASAQVDLYDLDVEKPYAAGIFMRPISEEVAAWNDEGKGLAAAIIGAAGDHTGLETSLDRVNSLSTAVDDWVDRAASEILDEGKILGIVGGDHSVPFGALRATARKSGPFGVLHFDAHSDTRRAYEGFVGSHASIMFNVLERIPEVEKIVQVGIRDVCEEEIAYVGTRNVAVFFDRDIAIRKMDGERFSSIAREIAAALPEQVWVSFDIDGLDPRFCPHTGTPVLGGLDLHEVTAILREVVRAKKRIIGFDLNEVAPNLADPDDDWDGNVGARILYKLIGFTLASQGRAKLR